jgi:hypothetical protein
MNLHSVHCSTQSTTFSTYTFSTYSPLSTSFSTLEYTIHYIQYTIVHYPLHSVHYSTQSTTFIGPDKWGPMNRSETSLSLCLCRTLSVALSLSLSLCPSVSLSLTHSLSVCLSVTVSFCLSLSLSLSLSPSLSLPPSPMNRSETRRVRAAKNHGPGGEGARLGGDFRSPSATQTRRTRGKVSGEGGAGAGDEHMYK